MQDRNATTEITDNAAELLTGSNVSTITDLVAGALGDYVDEHDVDGIEREYREALQAALPAGWTLAGEFIFAKLETRDAELDRAALDAIDFWAIAERHAL